MSNDRGLFLICNANQLDDYFVRRGRLHTAHVDSNVICAGLAIPVDNVKREMRARNLTTVRPLPCDHT